jgi:hypothetical protein
MVVLTLFHSFDKLERHLIFIHSESVVDYTAADNMTKQEDEDFLICKAFSERCDRKFIERLKSQYGLDLDL